MEPPAANEIQRRRELTFVFVGAATRGRSVGELADLVRDALRHTVASREATRWVLVDAAPKSCPIPTRLGDYAAANSLG